MLSSIFLRTGDAESVGFCYSGSMKTTITRVKLPSVKAVEAAPTGRQLYVWMKDGRSGVVDMSDWTGHPCDKWDTEGFSRWKVDAGMACWGEDSHISPVLCADELVEMPYEEWRSAFEPLSVPA